MKLLNNKQLMRKVLAKKKPQNLTLRQYYDKRNTVLIYRRNGGLGDILAHRMLFEDIKLINPDAYVVFACPAKYHQCVEDHPFIDELKDSELVDPSQYMLTYDTSSACMRHELTMAPFSDKNRSDIWANHCGIKLQNHNMHLNIDQNQLMEVQRTLDLIREGKPTALFTPISAMYNKNLLPWQMEVVIKKLRDSGFFVYGSHIRPIDTFTELDVPILKGNIKKWMAIVAAADCVVTVDTAAVHMAGGLGKPTTAIFTFTDGKVYTRYYSNCVLVQKHRDNGDWDCGPCYNWAVCPKSNANPKPCLKEITPQMLVDGIDTMLINMELAHK